MQLFKDYIFKTLGYIFSHAFSYRKMEKDLPCSPKRILMVKTHAIGDAILVTPAIRALRNRYPGSEIVLLTGRQPEEIIDGNKDINEILSFDESALFNLNLLKIIKLIKMVRKEHFIMSFIFHYSSLMHLLVLAFGIPYRIGFDKDGTGFSLTHKLPWDNKGEHWTADVSLDLARFVGANTEDKSLKIEISKRDMGFADNLLRDYKICSDDILIGIFPGGGKNPRDIVYQKRWGIEKYATIIDILSARYGAKIIIFGSPNDKKVVSKLINISKTSVINTSGKVNLKQLSALIKKCSLLITNDSAPLHIAVAVDTPTVSLFGPSRARAIVEENEKHIPIQSTYPCSPCYCNSRFPGCDNPQCMEAISCNEVLAIAERQLNKFNFNEEAKNEKI